jgi:3-methyladenine DNA glycosylase AlkD
MPDSGAIIRRLRAVPATTVPLRAERRRISRELKEANRSEMLRLAHELIDASLPRFVAYELVLRHEPTLNGLTVAEVEALGEGIASWGDIDCFGCFIAGPAWRLGNLPDRLIRSWARSDDWCWRRAALVATVPLRDTARALAICRLLVDDREDLVVKALSWALRTVAKYDAAAASMFLADYRDRLAARVIREVGNKLATGLKNPRYQIPGSRRKRVSRVKSS